MLRFMITLSAGSSACAADAGVAERLVVSRGQAADDRMLVDRFNAGDETAFVEIMARHRVRLFGIAFSLLRNRADAEEITQDAFIRAHRGLAHFRGDSSLMTWLHRITLNLARNRYWHGFRRGRFLSDSLDAPLGVDSTATFADRIPAREAGPARDAIAEEFSRLVVVCMDRLGPPSREILFRRNRLQRSYREIAAELGINVGTVKSRIARAREQLRVLLVAACPEFQADARPGDWFETVRPSGRMESLSVG